MKEKAQKLKTAIPVSLFFVYTVIFYGPLSLYLSNSGDIWFGLNTVLKIVVPAALIIFAVLVLFFFLLPEKTSFFFQLLLFGISLAMYLQGNYLAAYHGTGVLDGTAVNWDAASKYSILNSLIWIICIFLPLILLRIFKSKVLMKKILIFGSLFIVAMQIPATVVQLISYRPNDSSTFKISTNGIYDLGKESNILIFVLDTMDENYYTEFIENHPEYTKELNGFVHYGNTLASGARTPIGLPSMITGHPFKRDAVYSDYIKRLYENENPLSILHEEGYQINVYSEAIYFSSGASKYIDNLTLQGEENASFPILLKKMYKLTAYQFFPHVLKKYVAFNTSEFSEAKADSDAYVVNDPNFFAGFREKGYSVLQKQNKTLHFYHLHGAHTPFIMDNRGIYDKNSTIDKQVEGCFYCVAEMLDGLREQGLYDNATVIITADHGDLNKAQFPVFLLKEAGNVEPYRSSDVPASLYDLPIFLTGLVSRELNDQEYGVDLYSLNEDTERERHFFWNQSGNSHFVINEYITNGHAGDFDAIKKVDSYQDSDGIDTPYTLGTVLAFTLDATGNKYTVEGFGTNTGYRTILRGPYSKLQIPIKDIPETGELTIHFGLFNSGASGKKFVVQANGDVVLEGAVDKNLIKRGLNFNVPVSAFEDSNVLTIELLFPEISEKELEKKINSRTETISIKSLVIN